MALQLTEVEIKVEDATNNQPWGPHGKDMAEITKASYDIESYKQIMGVLARRLQDQGEDWRHVYKSLLLLEYMAKHGPQKVVEELVSNLGVIEKLTFFEHKDANGKDWGLNVRQRAKELVALVNDPERMRAERQKAKANEAKYTGVSSDDLRSGGFGAKSSTGFGSGSLGTLSAGSSTKYRAGGGLGGSGFGSDSRGTLYDDYDETSRNIDIDKKDPKEATRERIERLKREGVVDPDDPGAIPPARTPALKPGRIAVSEAKAEEPRGPKKLSDVKVNPSIAASLGQLPVPAAGSTNSTTLAAQSTPAPAAADLLLQLDGPAPGGAAEDSSWNAFEGPQQAAADKDWLSFEGVPSSSTTAGTSSTNADPFAQLSAPAPPASRAYNPAVDPFAQLSSGPTSSILGSSSQVADPFNLAKPAQGAAKAASQALPEDFFGVGQPQPAPNMGMALQQQPQGLIGNFSQPQQAGPGLGALAQQPVQGFASFAQPSGHSPTWQQQQQGFGAFQQPSSGFGQTSSGNLGYGGQFVGNSSQPKLGGQGTSSSTVGTSAPLNPAAQPLGPSSKAKDPFADLAAF
ncbi:g7247 [Coccomyxa elongata]